MNTTDSKVTYILFGCGAMGSIILEHLVRLDTTKSVTVIEQHIQKMDIFSKNEKVTHYTNTDTVMQDNFDVAIFAVKPQDFKTITLPKTDVLVSIMAGVSSRVLIDHFSHDRVVRVMPNTPAQLGFGMTGLLASPAVSPEYRETITTLFNQMGKTVWLESDDDIDRFTAIAGSGPAYVYRFVQDYIRAAEALGETDVQPIIMQVMLGALEMIKHNNDRDVQELIDMVTSKGGTTEAALNVVSEKDTPTIWKQALDAAYKRAQELSQAQE
jgi:pyrroline-5-carboxylate reductase